MGISSAGIGSGLDVTSIVKQLVSLERKPIEQLQTAASSIQTKISTYGKVQSLMSTLRDTASALGSSTLWKQTTATPSDATVLTATASGAPPTGDYQIEVSKLAKAHSLYSAPVTINPGVGSMTISSGGNTATLSFTSNATTVEDVRDAINGADIGVTAAVIKDSSGTTRLALASKATGSANQISVSTTGVDYAGFNFNPADPTASPGMTQAQAAQDAELTVNGVPVTSDSNTVTNAIDGVTLNLTKTTSGPVKLAVASDSAAQKKAMEDFVAAYNALNSYLAEQTKYDEGTKKAGGLQGDSSAVSLRNQLRNAVLQSSSVSSVFDTLGNMGISLQKDGSLKLDSTKVTEALKKPEELGKFFANVDTVTPANNGLGVSLRKLADTLTDVDGPLTLRTSALQAQLKRNQTDQDKFEERVARTQARLEKYYQAMDTKMGSLNALSSYVTQQISSWNKSSSDD